MECCRRKCSWFLSRLFILALSILSYEDWSLAEPVNVDGLALRVDQLVPVDESNIKVKLGSDERVIAKTELSRYALEQFFSQKDLFSLLEPSEVEKFIIASIDGGKYEQATVALRGVVAQSDSNDIRVPEILEVIGANPKSIQVLKDLLKSLPDSFTSPRIICVLLSQIGHADLPWLRANAVRRIYLFGDELRVYLKEHLYSAISKGRSEIAQQTLQFYGELFGNDDSDFKRLNALNLKFQRLSEGIRKDDIDSIFPLVELGEDSDILRRLIAPGIVEAVHKSAETSILKGDYEAALNILSNIEFDKRTPTTHALILRALGSTKPPASSIVENAKITGLIKQIAQVDDGVRQAFLQFLERTALYNAGDPSFRDIGDLMSLIVTMRPDPSRDNDALRAHVAISLVNRGRVMQARSLLSDMRTREPFFERLRVGWALFMADDFSRTLVAIAGILLFGLIGLRLQGTKLNLPKFKSRDKSAQNKNAGYRTRASVESETEDDYIPPQFVTARAHGDTFIKEYHERLVEFGLKADADLRMIKAAYRTKAKEIHPDYGHQDSTSDPQQFIDLKSNYERLIELRKRLGFD